MADDIIPGGETDLLDPSSNPRMGRGVYAQHPAQTPKYHTGNGVESLATQARMFLEFSDDATFKSFRESLPERAKKLVDVLSPQSKVGGVGYFDFLMSRVSESFQEKVQVSEVLSDGHIAYFFGQKAPMWQVSGRLLNTQQDQWYDAFHILYQDVLRGTQLARHRIPLKIAYDNRVVVGSLVSMNTTLSADSETAVPFNFQILVSRVYIRQPEQLQPTDVADAIDRGLVIGKGGDGTEFSELFGSLADARKHQDIQQITKVKANVRAGNDPAELAKRLDGNNQSAPNMSNSGEQSLESTMSIEDPQTTVDDVVFTGPTQPTPASGI